MLRFFVFAVILAGITACVQRPTTVHKLFGGKLEVSIPNSYSLYERPQFRDLPEDAPERRQVEFVRFGGNEALRRKFPDHPFGETFLDGFAGKDVQANILVFIVELIPEGEPGEWEDRSQALVVPRNATARAVHEHFCRSFAGYWGESGFSLFDSKLGIGHCVNYAGAFVSAFERWVGDTLVVVTGLDFVEALIFEKKGPGAAFLQMPPEEKWRKFRDASNADVAEQVLLSAKIHDNPDP
ncbi:hypothetical protein [Pelagibius marinus]|uniref:hypothetical protein n=1 Tax=Pelagibius marinus TaxID=2762760 RepID=UPI001872DF76|nr:hypothetical protein [Pelagibius marinus]